MNLAKPGDGFEKRGNGWRYLAIAWQSPVLFGDTWQRDGNGLAMNVNTSRYLLAEVSGVLGPLV